MGNLLTAVEKADEVRKLVLEGKTFEEALEIIKGYPGTDQSILDNHTKNYNDIIPQKEGASI